MVLGTVSSCHTLSLARLQIPPLLVCRYADISECVLWTSPRLYTCETVPRLSPCISRHRLGAATKGWNANFPTQLCTCSRGCLECLDTCSMERTTYDLHTTCRTQLFSCESTKHNLALQLLTKVIWRKNQATYAI